MDTVLYFFFFLPRQPLYGSHAAGAMEGTSFQEVMHQAAKMKGKMLDDDRRRFLAWPEHLQHSLYHEDAVCELQERPMAERIEAADRFKAAGNELLHEGDAQGAVNEYERALALFHYARSTDPKWKTTGIRDCNLVLHHDTGSTPAHREAVRRLRVALLLNLALARLHLHQPGRAVALCSEALTYEPGCAKALVRRAKARVAPLSAGATEEELAIRDLQEATSALSRRDAPSPADTALLRRAATDLRRLQASKRARTSRDATVFSGLFSRGRIYEDNEASARRRRASERGRGTAASPAERDEGEGAELEARIADLRSAARAMREKGKISEAAELEEVVTSSEQRMARARERRRGAGAAAKPLTPQDFDIPTEEMRRDAKAHGWVTRPYGGVRVGARGGRRAFDGTPTQHSPPSPLPLPHVLGAVSTSMTQWCGRSCNAWRWRRSRRRGQNGLPRGMGPPSGLASHWRLCSCRGARGASACFAVSPPRAGHEPKPTEWGPTCHPHPVAERADAGNRFSTLGPRRGHRRDLRPAVRQGSSRCAHATARGARVVH